MFPIFGKLVRLFWHPKLPGLPDGAIPRGHVHYVQPVDNWRRFCDGRVDRGYAEPRMDQGKSFGYLLERLLTEPRPNPLNHPEHLQGFSAASYQSRLGIFMDKIRKTNPQGNMHVA